MKGETDTLGQLVGRLEAMWVDLEDAGLSELARLLADRQDLLTQIQQADASQLDVDTRRELFERLTAVRQRDDRLLEVILEKRRDVEKGLDTVLHARSAARGYRRAGAVEKGRSRIA